MIVSMVFEAEKISWPGWEVVDKLGEGSFGGVYEIQRTLPGGHIEKAALKKLTVPREQGEIEELYAQNIDRGSITEHFKNQMEELVREYSIMQELSGHPNIVNCQDLRYIQHGDGIGWDIYIRMELLKPLKQIRDNTYSEERVLKLGLNMCSALSHCHKRNIIHRDIKPENILVSENGVYKLGDFGIAKISEKTATGTMAGTYGYMAPEVANHQHYGASADVYSLGLVLYWMMNRRTLPFLPLPPAIPSVLQRQEAQECRLSGQVLPAPIDGSPELKKIVLKACDFSPEKRFHTIQEFGIELQECFQLEKQQDFCVVRTVNPLGKDVKDEYDCILQELGISKELISNTVQMSESDQEIHCQDDTTAYEASFETHHLNNSQRKTIFVTVILLVLIAAELFALLSIIIRLLSS